MSKNIYLHKVNQPSRVESSPRQAGPTPSEMMKSGLRKAISSGKSFSRVRF